jgi:hypothetical protein
MGNVRRYGLGLVLIAVAAAGCGAPDGEDAPAQDEVDKVALSGSLVFEITVGTSTTRVGDVTSLSSSATEVDFTHPADPLDPVLTSWAVNGTLINRIRYGTSFVTQTRNNVYITQITHFTTPRQMVQYQFQ